MNYIGIDFSIASPAYCIIEGDDVSKWGTLYRGDRSPESLKKNSSKPYHILLEDNSDLFNGLFIIKDQLPDEYSERERIKINYFLDIVDTFWDSIIAEMNGRKFKVAMEGLSFSSNGNSLIDISMATALLRERIIDRVGVENFFVYSPTSVKKFAIKGNAKKDQLYRTLKERESTETNLSRLSNILRDNESEWITPKGNVNKPVDDIVDSTWIALFLKEQEEITNKKL